MIIVVIPGDLHDAEEPNQLVGDVCKRLMYSTAVVVRNQSEYIVFVSGR